MSSLCWLVLIAAVSAVFRFFPTPAHCGVGFGHLPAGRCRIPAGPVGRDLWTRALTPENYTAIGYWPPLFPMLAGLLGNAWTLAAGAGWLLFLPVFVLARNLWQDEDTALLASGLVALHPLLAWYARVPRTESLFLLLYALGLALALSPAPGGDRGARPGPGRFLLGGAFLGLAYATRFDMLLILPAVLLWQILLRTRREAWVDLLGFFLAALPYLVYLAWLNEDSDPDQRREVPVRHPGGPGPRLQDRPCSSSQPTSDRRVGSGRPADRWCVSCCRPGFPGCCFGVFSSRPPWPAPREWTLLLFPLR